jgi:hypothetical protein
MKECTAKPTVVEYLNSKIKATGKPLHRLATEAGWTNPRCARTCSRWSSKTSGRSRRDRGEGCPL